MPCPPLGKFGKVLDHANRCSVSTRGAVGFGQEVVVDLFDDLASGIPAVRLWGMDVGDSISPSESERCMFLSLATEESSDQQSLVRTRA